MTTMVGIDLEGKQVLVVGAGEVGARRAVSLHRAGAGVVVVSPEVSDAVASLAASGEIALHQREVAASDLDGCWWVVAASDSADVNRQVAEWAMERHIWCVNASQADAGSARMVAQAEVGSSVVGVVSAGDPDPARSVALRDAILAAWESGQLDTTPGRMPAGRVALVGAGPGDPSLLTLRGAALLREAHVVVADRLGTAAILDSLPDHIEVVDVGKSPGNHPVPQRDINALVVERALQGQRVVRLKGGDPFVFGRGGEEAHACLTAGIDLLVVPGITSALAGPAAADIPVTQRGITHEVLIVSGHAGADPVMLAAMHGGATVVLLMAVAALPGIVEEALADGVDGGLPVAIIENATTAKQRVTRDRLDAIVATATQLGVTNPAVVVVGDVAAADLLRSAAAATPEQS